MTALRRYDPATDSELLDVEKARAYLERATDPVDVKKFRDQAAAVALYMREQKASAESVVFAQKLQVRAERRLGELTAKQEKAKGTRAVGGDAGGPKLRPPDPNSPPTYAEQGLDKRDVSRWQKLAAIPEKKFEATLESLAEHNRPVSTGRVLAVAAPKPKPEPKPQPVETPTEEPANDLPEPSEPSEFNVMMAMRELDEFIQEEFDHCPPNHFGDLLMVIRKWQKILEGAANEYRTTLQRGA